MQSKEEILAKHLYNRFDRIDTATFLKAMEEYASQFQPPQPSKDVEAAAKELLHLHLCEQEGLLSGQPTRDQWFTAVDNLSNALYKNSEQAKETVDGWVSVKEGFPKLPPPHYEDGVKITPVTDTAIVYDGEDVFTDFYGEKGFRNEFITHWQHLPKPPKSGELKLEQANEPGNEYDPVG